MARRRWLVPEVIQTSAMDCGPAALAALLAGFGRPVSVERLREACNTSVDGTSIGALEELGRQLGFQTSQEIVLREHLPHVLPLIAITRRSNGEAHFIVLWSAVGPWIQVMDPNQGRRWVRRDELVPTLTPIGARFPIEQWRAWAESPTIAAWIAADARALGFSAPPPTDAPVPRMRFEAAVRFARVLREEGGLAAGEARALVERLAAVDTPWDAPDAPVPPSFWSVRPFGDEVIVEGVLVLRCDGPDAEAPEPAALPAEVRAILEAERQEALPFARALLSGRASPDLPDLPARAWARALLPLCVAAAALGELAEVLVLRGLLDVGAWLGSSEMRLYAAAGLGLFLAARLALDGAAAAGVAWLGRQIEGRLRAAFLTRLAGLPDRFLHSRLPSDLAERAQLLTLVGRLPRTALRLLAAGLGLALSALALVLVEPATAPAVALMLAVSLVMPLWAVGRLSEQEASRLNHEAALGRFYLDALQGAVCVRAHGAGPALQLQQEARLTAWARVVLRFEALALRVRAGTGLVGLVGVLLVVGVHLLRSGASPAALVVLWWALRLSGGAQELVAEIQSLPTYRATLLSLRQLLAAPAEPDERRALPPGPVALRFVGVGVVVAGRPVLRDVDLHVAPGEHVAVVGRSGAGKSTLLGLLLGWQVPATGEIRVSGDPLGGALPALRRRTAWVDPAVRLWNRSVYANLLYGSDGARLAEALEGAEVDDVVGRMPDGLRAGVGDGGTRLSGGEGQRLRLARALLREGVDLVLLDEPFRGLEADRRHRLLERARAWWSGATLLCVTHDIEEALGFPRVLVVEDGRVVEDGAPEALLGAGGAFARMVGASAALRSELWEGLAWRRIRLERGRLVEGEGL